MTTSIEHRESSIENPSSFLCFLLKVGCSTFYVVRLSSFLTPLHLSRELYKSHLFLQNEPNFKNEQIGVSSFLIRSNDDFCDFHRRKNEPKRTQNEPNFSPKLASFSQNKPNFKQDYVKIGNLQWTILSGTVYSVFCVLCSVFFLPPLFVANNWLCFSTKIAVKWQPKIKNLTLWLRK